MKQFALIILMLTATSAWAEWTRVSETDDVTIYLDSETIRQAGSLVKVWTLRDYKTVQKSAGGGSYLSAKDQTQFDCREEQVRGLAIVLYSGRMGAGDVVSSGSDPTKWGPVIPDSYGKRLFNTLCGKQRERQEARELIDEYVARIQAKIRARIVIPPDISGNPEVMYQVTLFANGNLDKVTLTRSSGVPAYDNAVLRAIHAAEPLPLPADPELFQQSFREFRLTFRPIE